MLVIVTLLKAVGFGRNHGLYVALCQRVEPLIGVVAFVRQDGSRIKPDQQCLCVSNIRDLTTAEQAAQGITQGIHRRMYLGAQPTPRATDRLIARFFWARSEERRVGKECRSRWSATPYKKRSV